MEKARLCVDIGGTKTAFALFDENDREVFYRAFATQSGLGAENLVERVYDAVCGVMGKYSIERGVIAAPGPLDAENGVLISPVLLGWRNIPITHIFSEKFGFAFSLLNDCDAGALGVWRYGGYADVKTLCYISISTGIGGGTVINGRLLEGAGNASDFGHIPVSGRNIRCGCGKIDCLELYSSGSGIEARYAEKTGTKMCCAAISECAVAGDADAQEVFREASSYLTYALRVLKSVLDPECVVFGGSVCKVGDLLFSGIQDVGVPISFAGQDGKQVLYGALCRCGQLE